MRKSVIALSVLLATVPAVAESTLYKWVSPDGVVNFSDAPPADPATSVSLVPLDASPPPNVAVAKLDELRESDEQVAAANSRMDLAEHALAQARRPLWSPTDGLRLPREDTPREARQVDFYKRDILAARRALIDTLRRKNAALR